MKKGEKVILDEEDILEFDEFNDYEEALAKKPKEIKPEDLEKNFIFTITRGCPVCGSDIKGNDFYRYFCEKCNLLFDRKDVIENEFGKSVREAVRKRVLSSDEKEALARKRKELTGRVFDKFSPKEKEELVEAAETREEPEDVEAEMIPPHEEARPSIDETLSYAAAVEEPAEAEEENEEKEYELETPDKIIASKESTKMHAGTCHFVKKIHPENRIFLGSAEEGEEKGYEMCVCLRRIKARRR